MTNVAIVIPNYQGATLLRETLSALRAALQTEDLEVEVIVCDDASTDGSAELVESEFPWVRVLRRRTNGGFGATCNTGAEAVSAPFVYFLNSDAHVRPGFLAPLVEAMRAENVFGAMSLNLDESGGVLNPTQVTLEVRGLLRLGAPRALDRSDAAARLAAFGPVETLYGSGTALLVRRDRFLGLGGFAAAFGRFYYEDVDLGWRAWHRGWASLLVPTSVVIHALSETIGRTQDSREVAILRKRNRLLVLWRNLLDPSLLFWRHHTRLPFHLAGRLLQGDTTTWHGLRAAQAARREAASHRCAERREVTLPDGALAERLADARRRLQRHLLAP